MPAHIAQEGSSEGGVLALCWFCEEKLTKHVLTLSGALFLTSMLVCCSEVMWPAILSSTDVTCIHSLAVLLIVSANSAERLKSH